MKHLQHNLVQGSEEWRAFRATHYGASEAAAMLGLSPYMTRSELLKLKATGIAKDVSAATQRVFDTGHETEIGGRALAEAFIDEELYPVVVSVGNLSASCDGLNMSEDLAWEHKQWSKSLAESLSAGSLPEHHQPQCQQVMLLTGAPRLLFTCSDGTDDNCVHLMVESDKSWHDRLKKGWEQFQSDLDNYQHVEVIPAAVAAPIAELPALNIQINGSVVASNLGQWKDIVVARISGINTDLTNDSDFATAESTVKFLDEGEKKIDMVKAQAQSQASDIDTIFRAMDEIKAMMRSKRLELDRLVKARKESIRIEILHDGMEAYKLHVLSLDERLGKMFMPQLQTDFPGAIKGKRSIESLKDAVATELARAKIAANEVADKIQRNLNEYNKLATGYETCFADLKTLVLQSPDAFTAMVEQRIAKRKQEVDAAEQARKAEDERKSCQAKAAEQAKAESVVTTVTQPAKGNGASPIQVQPAIAISGNAVIVPQHIGITGSGAILDAIDDELRSMTVPELQQVLDAIRSIRARKAA